MSALLEIQNLSISFFTPKGEIQAVRDVSFSLKPGEVLAVVGESGCGKSVMCKGIMRLLCSSAKIKTGSIFVNGVDITHYKERDMHKLRGKLFSMIFQDPMTSLNPTMTIGTQIAEAVKVHQPKISKKDLDQRVIELMTLVGIDHPKERKKLYPYHFSGGMRQRSVMAIALAGNPQILFADEPTTSLDVTIQAQILDLLRKIQKTLGTATVFVTHDLSVAAKAADRIAVMYAGKIVEIGTTEEIFYDPRHPYTWGLMQALPAFSKSRDELRTIKGMPPNLISPPKGDAFACRNEYALAIDYEQAPPMFPITDTHYAATWLLDKRAPKIIPPVMKLSEDLNNQKTLSFPEKSLTSQKTGECMEDKSSDTKKEVLLDVQHLSHTFTIDKKFSIKAVDDVSFQIRQGEIFGLVGESGSGKSTVARCIMNIYTPQRGRIFYKGIDTCCKKDFQKNKKMLQRERQLIFQDSASSLNERMKVGSIIAEPMKIQHITPPRGTCRKEVEFQMHYVGLDKDFLAQYPAQLSGGQRQRVAIARALSIEPKLLVADEPVASLDVSIQAQIINLFKHLQKEHGFSFLFITHDLAMVEFLCDRVGVMYHGKLVETAPVKELFQNPRHPYTKALLSAIPIPDPQKERSRTHVTFEEKEDSLNGILTETTPQHFVLMKRRTVY